MWNRIQYDLVITEVQRKKGYGFIEKEAFLAKLCDRVSQIPADQLPVTKEGLVNLAKTIYSEEIYAGCLNPDRDIRDRAYEELGYMLFRVGFFLLSREELPDQVSEITEECVQNSLIQIYLQIQNIRKPGSFIFYTITVLRREVMRILISKQKRGGHEIPLDEDNEEVIGMPDVLADEPGSLLNCFLEAFKRLSNPNWVKVLILEYFADLNDVQIGQMIQKTPNNVYQMRLRAKEALKKDPELIQCLGEENINIDSVL